jgi:hypothetical protein
MFPSRSKNLNIVIQKPGKLCQGERIDRSLSIAKA